MSERRKRVDAADSILGKVRDDQRANGENYSREEILLSVIASMTIELVELAMEGRP